MNILKIIDHQLINERLDLLDELRWQISGTLAVCGTRSVRGDRDVVYWFGRLSTANVGSYRDMARNAVDLGQILV